MRGTAAPAQRGTRKGVLYASAMLTALTVGGAVVYSAGAIDNMAETLYGTTKYGGNGSGTVWQLTPNGNGGWTFQTIYHFRGSADGSSPSTGLVLDLAS
jgi:hypothetical protein